VRTSQAVFYAVTFFWLDGFAVPTPAQVIQTIWLQNRKDKEMNKRKSPNLRKQKLISGIISFLIGAFILSLFSVFQKLIMHEVSLALNPKSYLVPVIYGGTTGLLLGLWYFRLKQKENELLESYNSTLKGWAKAVEMRDKSTQNHTERVVVLMERLSRAMKVPENKIVHMRQGALLHDIGKIGVPDSILNKPGALTEEETRIMRQHPLLAKNMLDGIPFLQPSMEIPCCHHERWDGSGYPHGFKEEEIPLAARIFAVIDVWDALVTDRPYRRAWKIDDALTFIEENSGKLFDPSVVQVFLENADQFLEYYDAHSEQKTNG
jgi:HD-GYP domain-containing protein (c-di-GMP phosphodiesterase class II)